MASLASARRCEALLKMAKLYWPNVRFYGQQRAVIQSVVENRETVVVAGNQLGKDFVAGFVVLSFFLCPQLYFEEGHVSQIEKERRLGQPDWQVHTRRIVTTSVDGDQLRNLWGEIGRYVVTSRVPLLEAQGGPLLVNQRDISLKEERSKTKEPLNYLIGRVTATGEGLSGAHAAYNLMVIDEASGSDNAVYEFAQGWAKKFLIFGNPNTCENFFRRAVQGGDLEIK